VEEFIERFLIHILLNGFVKEVTMWYNAFVVAVLRSPLHGLLSRDMLLLSYTGRTSGRPYTLPLNYIKIGDALLILSMRSRTWWRNLRDGAEVSLRLRGHERTATSEVCEDAAAVAAGLRRMLAERPGLGRFFGVAPGLTGLGDEERLAAAAVTRVIVQVYLG
jgi:deazaflavin-dependent oxidoreductase (nitroreductase family)